MGSGSSCVRHHSHWSIGKVFLASPGGSELLLFVVSAIVVSEDSYEKARHPTNGSDT